MASEEGKKQRTQEKNTREFSPRDFQLTVDI
jgi:hypothetical protein